MNKKFIALTFSFTIISISLFAQRDDFPFQFGFKVAPNIGWVKPNADSYKYNGITAGFSWGIIGEYSITENYAINSGITFCSSGGKLEYPYKFQIQVDSFETGIMERRYSLRYIEIPFTLKMKTREIGYLVYYGQFGLGTCFRYAAKAKDTYNVTLPVPGSYTKEPDINGDIRFLKETLIIGAGVEYTISGNTRLLCGLVFENGLTNILMGKNSQDTKIAQKATSNFVELNIGVVF